MGRTKGFERTEVLDRAIHVFRTKGYEAASIQDLVSAMGINRFSIYDAFGDKRQLFLESLDQYQVQRRTQTAELFMEPGPRLPLLRRYLENIIDFNRTDQPNVCLIVNSAIELAKGDEEIAERARTHFSLLEEIFTNALIEARTNGEIDSDRDLRAVARFLLNAGRGLRVVANYNKDREALVEIVDMALSVLYKNCPPKV